ncbi:hypothetical protein LLEC1_04266 [Akanthomyces lecanii]|uniref:Xylanolytic transcriptional activator regulatory domain-containing protein n=1 Tax=Cordyceps confragosa TaxID=2714763 RepID=A0A179I9J2_CORDF|nr:hypothetical protein LLEC1_04266 [Akanthomyces lecanii]
MPKHRAQPSKVGSVTEADTLEKPKPPYSRRRDKPQLSCHACRKRKLLQQFMNQSSIRGIGLGSHHIPSLTSHARIRCDREYPCSNCSSRGLGSSCAFTNMPVPALSATAAGSAYGFDVQERITRLETVVLDLMHQSSSKTCMYTSFSVFFPTTSQGLISELIAVAESLSGKKPPSHGPKLRTAQSFRLRPQSGADINRGSYPKTSASPSDYGSFRNRSKGISYVSGSHWVAVLDSIADLKNHLCQEDEPKPSRLEPDQLPESKPLPQLLYSFGISDTPTSIINGLPPRSVVDRLVSCFFNTLEVAPGVLHSGQFLREYEAFWKAPQETSIVWVGLLLSVMALSTQYQQALAIGQRVASEANAGHFTRPSEADEKAALVEDYKCQAIKCLHLGQYTRGGPHVLETLCLYTFIECFHLKDMDVGISVLIANLVQIALHMGYHRDAKHFTSISPFAGEMRRRVWATIVQLDFSISTQLGLPGVLRQSHVETSRPRNLFDHDFDETTLSLPDSRPETEVTPILYVLAKLRLVSVGRKVVDMATDLQQCPYTDIIAIDQEIDDARGSLPSSLRWKGFALTLNVSSVTALLTIWLHMITLQLKVILYKKFLNAAQCNKENQQSRSTCLLAAMELLALQHLVEEEIQPGGLLYESRWRISSTFTNPFLLATSVLCFYVQGAGTHTQNQESSSEDEQVEEADTASVKDALKKSLAIWIRQCSQSREARKAAVAVHHILDNPGASPDLETPINNFSAAYTGPSFSSAADVSYFPGALVECNSDFTGAFLFYTAEEMAWPAFASKQTTNAVDVSYTYFAS